MATRPIWPGDDEVEDDPDEQALWDKRADAWIAFASALIHTTGGTKAVEGADWMLREFDKRFVKETK